VKEKDSAAATFDPIIEVGFLVKCAWSDLILSRKRHVITDEVGAPGMVYAYLHNDDCSEMAPGLDSVIPKPRNELTKLKKRCKSSDEKTKKSKSYDVSFADVLTDSDTETEKRSSDAILKERLASTSSHERGRPMLESHENRCVAELKKPQRRR
jgi:hypothetical protein